LVQVMEETAERQLFKISAVARLTGISVHTLRKWEERHGAVHPRRSKGGKRLYTDTDVQRLVLIKKLADQGLSLHSIAACSFDELADRWDRLSRAELPSSVSRHSKIAVLGKGVAAWLSRRQVQLAGAELVAAADDLKDLERRLDKSGVDVLVIECPAVARGTSQDVREIMRALDVPKAVVVYWFGNQQHVEALQSAPQLEVLRAPVDSVELQQAIARIHGDRRAPLPASGHQAAPTASDPLPPRLSRESLAKMAVANPNASCGCQKNLVDVVLSLLALEEYLGGCENRSPDDEALHRALARKVGEARSSIEDAIEHFAAVEGIEL
jgi:DNA-binding transcriptional MerR regulator